MQQATTSNTTAQQHQTALIRRREVERVTTLSRSRIYALMDKGEFPAPVRLGAKSVAWVSSEVQEWLDARITARSSGVKS